MTGRVRDSQRSRVYAAEDWAAVTYSGSHWRQTIANDDLQGWVDAVLARATVRGRFGTRQVRVRLGRNGGHANHHTMTLGVRARNEWVILHELAHSLTWSYVSAGSWAPHGPEWAGVYVFLVETVIGPDAAKVLREKFRDRRVRSNRKGIPAFEAGRVAAARERAAAAKAPRPVTRAELSAAADTIRRAAREGRLGAADRKPRVHALATARLLMAACEDFTRPGV